MSAARARPRAGTPRPWLAALAVVLAGAAHAQNPNQFGGQARADAASQLIVFSVERALDSLPAVSGQAVTYEFDPASDAFVRGTRLGPTVLPTSQTIAPGAIALQLATSYFTLAETFRPINYLFTRDDAPTDPLVAKIGLGVQARVALLNLSATYGISQRVEVGLSIPISVIDAQAQQIFSTRRSLLDLPPREAVISGARVQDGDVTAAIETLNAGLAPGQPLALRRDSFTALGFDFNDGTHAGIGRISLGGKGRLVSLGDLQVAAAGDLFLPSPSEAEFAGPDSVAVYPRLIGTFKVIDALRLSSDLGYSYDMRYAELRRFAWTVGASVVNERASFDLGLGGSQFAESLQWTPATVHGAPATTGVALDAASTGTTLVNVLVGGKLLVAHTTVIAAGLSVPIVSPAFQPDLLGTIAVEHTF